MMPFPFDEIVTQSFENHLTWTFEELLGYLETWPATQHYILKNNKNCLELIYDMLKAFWQRMIKK